METCPCPRCGAESPFRLRPDTTHYGEIRCAVHGHEWIRKPENERKPRRKANRKLLELFPADRRDFCWCCLRSASTLAMLTPSLQLEVHHVVEVVDGGSNDLINLQVLCNECHSETHRRRESFQRYETPAESTGNPQLDW